MNGKNSNKGVKVVENQIEGFSFVLFNNGDENMYQNLEITFKGALRNVGVIAPIDLSDYIVAINESNDIDTFIENIKGTWSVNAVERAIDWLFDLSNGF